MPALPMVVAAARRILLVLTAVACAYLALGIAWHRQALRCHSDLHDHGGPSLRVPAARRLESSALSSSCSHGDGSCRGIVIDDDDDSRTGAQSEDGDLIGSGRTSSSTAAAPSSLVNQPPDERSGVDSPAKLLLVSASRRLGRGEHTAPISDWHMRLCTVIDKASALVAWAAPLTSGLFDGSTPAAAGSSHLLSTRISNASPEIPTRNPVPPSASVPAREPHANAASAKQPRTIITSDEEMDAVIRDFQVHVLQDAVGPGLSQHDLASLLFFTVVDLGPRPVDNTGRPSANDNYAEMILNWDLGIQMAFSSPAVRAGRLIVGTNNETCDALLLRGLSGCVVDVVTPLRFEPAARPPADHGAMGGLVTYKYYWTSRALALGVQVLYTDVDVIFRRGMDPLDKLLLAPRRLSSPSGAIWPPIPDLQVLSDHAEMGTHVVPLISEPVRCKPTFQATLNVLAHSTHDWRNSLYTADVGRSRLRQIAAATVPAHIPANERDFLGLECEIAYTYHPKPVACFSTGFWLAQPTESVRGVFARTMASQTNLRPNNWEQHIFNRDLPSSVDVLFPNITVVVLDPRLAGNVWEQQCALSMNLTGAVASLPQPVDPVITHFGYVRGQNKKDTMQRTGLWYVPKSSPNATTGTGSGRETNAGLT